ncbi:MAG: metallophosphoesterase family protein, partial [Myxococcota bacterium]|nr:metallophosphoesterase family protein [Myxococcota bacterium]
RQHHARLSGLQPGTLHCYEVRDSSGARLFGPAGFRTAPAADDTTARVSLIALGDSGGGGADQRAVAAQLETVPHELMLHVGDVAYNDATLPELESNHFAIYRELASAIPLFAAIGDHDDSTDHAGPFREVFGRPRYYSFDWGPVHVLVLDAGGGGSAQREFAERDLASTDRRWKIVITHEPPYSSGFHGSSSSMRRDYVPLFERHGVQLVLSGDDHDYERSIPIAGVTYVVTGGGGRSVRPVDRSDWTAFSAMAFHFVHIDVDGDVMRVRAIDATGREFDGVEIPRERG